MNEAPLISVIVPVYKVERYLDRCVQSIVDQTYKNLEIILVDDGSPDNCPAMCDAWAEKDRRVRVIHKENGGVASARNVGIENTGGGYICFVDSDDWIEKNTIKILYDQLLNHGADISGCAIVTDYANGNSRICDISNIRGVCEPAVALQEFFESTVYYCSIQARLYSVRLIGDTRFSNDLRTGEDGRFNYEIMKKSPAVVVDKEKAMYHLVQNANSLTRANHGDGENWVDNVRAYEFMFDEQQHDHILSELAASAFAETFMISTLHLVGLGLIQSDALRQVVSIFNEYKKHLKKVRVRGFWSRFWKLYLFSPRLFCAGLSIYYRIRKFYYGLK